MKIVNLNFIEDYIASLHEDLIVEILLRLPVSSLSRFKCVCKSWRSLFCDPQFAKSHFDLAASPSDRILYNLRYLDSDCLIIKSIDLSDYSELSVRIPPPTPSIRYKGIYRRLYFWGSCRGFVLLRYYGLREFIVWNPTIGLYRKVPICRWDSERSFVCGFGYDASTDDYLITVLKETELMLFSFKTSSWKYIHDLHQGKELYKEKTAGLPLNGALHWLLESRSEQVPVIIAFDLVQRRSLSEIPLPPDSTNAHLFELHTIGGCLGVMCQFSEWIEVWVMKEYKVLSSWTRLFVSVMGSPSEVCITNDEALFPLNFCCLRLVKEYGGEIIGRNYCCRISGETEGKINQQDLCQHRAYGGGLLLYSESVQCTMYRESLLSL